VSIWFALYQKKELPLLTVALINRHQNQAQKVKHKKFKKTKYLKDIA